MVIMAANSAIAESQNNISTLILLISSSGITAVIVAIITAMVNRRKLSAEATNIISQAAGGIVQRLEDENKRLNLNLEHMRNRVSDLELIENKRGDQMELYNHQIYAHLEYDRMLVEQLEKLGVTVAPPPPLVEMQ